MLIIFGGLPGVGKTSIARALAQNRCGASSIDTIEQAILDAGVLPDDDIGPVGYMVANRQATDNLKLGLTVIGDAVNSVEETRSEWRLAAERASKPYVQIELICSDPGSIATVSKRDPVTLKTCISPTGTRSLAVITNRGTGLI